MTMVFVKQVRKITGLILISSVIGLVLMSFLPWVTVTETDSNDQVNHVYYNLEMIKKSNDPQINSIENYLNMVSILFWIIIIISLLSYVGIILHVSKKTLPLDHIIMLLCCLMVVFTLLIVLLHWNLLQRVDNMSSISMSLIIQKIPLSYSLISYLIQIIVLVESIWYIKIVAPFSIKSLIKSIKQRSRYKKQDMPKTLPRQFNKKNEPIILNEALEPAEEKIEPPKVIHELKPVEEPVD